MFLMRYTPESWGDLVCAVEILPGVLHANVESSVEDSVAEHPVESHKNDPGVWMSPVWGQAERVVATQHGEEKATGKPKSSISVPKGVLYEKREQTLY